MAQKLGLWDRLKGLLGIDRDKETFFESVEDALLEADLGYRTVASLLEEWRAAAKEGRWKDPESLRQGLKALLSAKLKVWTCPEPQEAGLGFLILGVNGVGKTTTVAKMARWFQARGQKEILLAAADTFRAGAIDQLKKQGERLGLRVVAQQPGGDPGAVIYDACEAFKAGSYQVLIADTAGRLHNKEHLVRELQKVDKIARSRLEGRPLARLLVLDATTGQNALKQAEVFHEAVGVDAVLLTKFDSSARGGVAFSICQTLGLPLWALGTGEGLNDFRLFEPESFVERVLEGSP